ncbi:unnamed protein product [Withania somnifera]
MAVVQISISLCTSVRDVALSNPVTVSSIRGSTCAQFGTSFATGSPLLIRNSFSRIKAMPSKAASVSIRCEQNTKGESNLDVWLGRSAMNFGVTGPLPTVALAVTALVGVLTAVFIFQSASKN